MDRRISVEWSLNEIASTMNRTGIRSTELASVLLWNAKPEGDNLGSVLRAVGTYQRRQNLRVLTQYIF
jgi:hypothetical protein